MADEVKIPEGNVTVIRAEEQSTQLISLDYWNSFEDVILDAQVLEEKLIISAKRKDPAHMAFDILRTRLMQALTENKWRRIGVTSATAGSGKTFVAANLAISLARGETNRVVLLDLDLRKPDLAATLGIKKNSSMKDYLSGITEPEDFFLRVRKSLAVGINTQKVSQSAELLQSTMTVDVLDEMQDLLAPDVTIFDLPPLLASDEAIACFTHLDGVLLVVGGGETTDAEIRKAEQLLEGQVPLLGVVLNRSEDSDQY